jgi:hypothetical protein
MSKPRKQDGVVYSRKDGRILWMRYRDRNGKPCRESTQTEDWQEANRKLRERLQARDGNLLEAIRKGEALDFGEWVDSFLENYSRPPIRADKTHEANMRCAIHLKAAFPGRRLVEITPTQSKTIFVIVFGSEFGLRSLVATEKRESSSQRRCTRSFGFSGVC